MSKIEGVEVNEIIKENWYEDDQFANQYSTPAQKELIENRWQVFEVLIKTHDFGTDSLKVLDLGCGDGINIMGLKKILDTQGKTYAITGVDFNQSRLEKVKKRFPDVEVQVYDLIEDQWDKKFDLILFNHVLEHIRDDQKALVNLKSMLNPGGIVILGVPNEGCLIAKLRNQIFQRKILRYTDHVHFYTSDTLIPKIEKAGFVLKKIVREGIFMPHCRVTAILKRYRITRKITNLLAKLFPSQSAGLICLLVNGDNVQSA